MSRSSLFKQLEVAPRASQVAVGDFLAALNFDQAGLIPCITQQHDSGEVLMLAWMNRASLEESLASGRLCYLSRSRQRLWRKGESSGQFQWLRELRVDCDGDALLALVEQHGVACHTGRQGCFYLRLSAQGAEVMRDPAVPVEQLYGAAKAQQESE